ncbi:hypothetical protein [Methanohalobium sp.]|uniref:hypothetical protein n=1 Tax=Methanohalobium sp. TaxID=2837493 RepID=UPI0025D89B1F|nr:hypothetical protein [Methanohalobium sp.]
MAKKTIFILLILIFGFCSSATAYTLDDVNWVNKKTNTLHWGDSTNYNDYVITAKDFDYKESGKKYVSIEITKNGERKKLGALTVGESLSYRDKSGGDDVRVYIKKIKTNVNDWTGNMEDPKAKIQIQKRGLPNLKIHINTEKDTYDPKKSSNPSKITAELKVENKGNAEIDDVELNIDTGGFELVEGELNHKIESIEKGKTSQTFTVKLDVPLLWDKKSFDISADANGYDTNNDNFSDTESKSITIKKKWNLIVTKTVTDEIYMTDTAYVLVNVRNDGLCELNNINVNNPVTDKLELGNNITRNKTISLEPDETTKKLYSYSLQPLEPGKYKLPTASASFKAPNSKKYETTSDIPQIKINGPYLVFNKIVNTTGIVPGGNAKITVEIKNTGNKNTHVNVSDTDLPSNVEFVKGARHFKDVVKSGNSKSFSYTVKFNNEGHVKLPAATLTFIDMDGYSGKKTSNRPEMWVNTSANSEKQTDNSGSSGGSTSGSTNQKKDESEPVKQPGFTGLLTIGMFTCVYFLYRKQSK